MQSSSMVLEKNVNKSGLQIPEYGLQIKNVYTIAYINEVDGNTHILLMYSFFEKNYII